MANRSPGPVEPRVTARLVRAGVGFFVVPALIARDGIKIATQWVWQAPTVVKVVLVLLAVLSTTGGTFVVRKKLAGWHQTEVNAEWKKFEVAARGADEKELLAVLADILKMDPGNQDAVTRKAVLESGEA